MDDRGGTDNVIHLGLGPDGRLVRKSPVRPDKAGPTKTGSPVEGLYSTTDVARLFGFKPARIRYWQRTGLIEPTKSIRGRRYFSFRDLIGVRTAKALLDSGVPLREVRRSVEALRNALPAGGRPLSDMRIVADGKTVVVDDTDGPFEAATGQALLDFRVDGLQAEVVRMTEAQDGRRAAAYEQYLRGCKLDEDERTYDDAEAAYREALSLDPTLTSALTNLGNLFYRRDNLPEAERHYIAALDQDPDQPEALYNLGFLNFERGEIEQAIERFERALGADPAFADAHFNLAMAYEERGESERARPHWRTYLSLEPSGSWASIAQEHLKRPSS